MINNDVRANRYASLCARGCGSTVPAGDGALVRTAAGGWGAEHIGACPAAAPVAAPVEALEVGMYRQGESILKVQKSRETGNLYAKRLVVIGGARLIDADEAVVNFEFVYAPGAIRALTAADRMTLAEAKAFGIRYGVCCVCGAFLKDAKSVAAGIGPVCGGRV